MIHGRLFITLESMGVEKRVPTPCSTPSTNEKRKLATAEEMAEFLAAHGIDKNKFLSTFNSFAMKGQMAKAKEAGGCLPDQWRSGADRRRQIPLRHPAVRWPAGNPAGWRTS